MAGSAPEDLLTCERCHGFYAVEVPADGSDPRVRCNSCGHIREVDVAPVRKEDDKEKWTVIGPNGKTMTFGSWDKLVESRGSTPPKSTEEKKPASASALLDVTPTAKSVAPKLALAEFDSEPYVPVAAPSPAELAKSVAKSKAPEWAPAKPAPEAAPPSEKATSVELEAAALVDDNSDEEPAPLSLRDAIAVEENAARRASPKEDDEEAAPLSLRDAIPESEQSHELLSMRDVVVVPTPDDSAPAAPKRGALRTLPPTPSRAGVSAPPPTITVEDAPKSTPPKSGASSRPPAAAKATKDSAKQDGKKQDGKKPGARKDGDRKPATAVASVAEDEPKRGWLLPSLAVAGVALVLWRIMAASPSSPPAPPAATTTAATTSTPPDPTATATATTATATATATTATASATADTTPVASAAPTEPKPNESSSSAAPKTPRVAAKDPSRDTTASETPPPAAKNAGKSTDEMSMSDMLDHAGSARRSGDYATARDLYERVLRQSPGNVEANGGLGDVARAQGDLNAAKTSYERALAASPSYGPAQLGLADTEWDLGNHAGAQRRYAQIVERMGDRAPERAKQRGAASE